MPPKKKKKKVQAVVRLQQDGGAANVAKIGQSLGAYGINIVQVVNAFNEATSQYRGLKVPADVVIYEDRSTEVVAKTPATTSLLLQAAGSAKGSPEPHKSSSGSVTQEQLREIAAVKMPDLNTYTVEDAAKVVEGSARSMGIKVVA